MIGLSFNPSSGKAQDLDQLHEKIKQNWAFPDCGTTRESVVFTDHFYIKSSSGGLELVEYDILSGGDDYRALARGKNLTPARIENDGILKIGTLAQGAPRNPKWENTDFDHVEEYTACAKPSDSFPKAMTRLMRYLDRLKEQCTVSVTNDCARVVFKLADENNDQVLSQPEIRKGIMTGLLFAELADKQAITTKDIGDIADRTKKESPEIAAQLLKQLDANKSGTLDYNEIVTDFTPWPQPFIKDLLKKAGHVIPVFSLAANRF